MHAPKPKRRLRHAVALAATALLFAAVCRPVRAGSVESGLYRLEFRKAEASVRESQDAVLRIIEAQDVLLKRKGGSELRAERARAEAVQGRLTLDWQTIRLEGDVRISHMGLTGTAQRVDVQVPAQVLVMHGTTDAPAQVRSPQLKVQSPRLRLAMPASRISGEGPVVASFQTGQPDRPPLRLRAAGGFGLQLPSVGSPGRLQFDGPVVLSEGDTLTVRAHRLLLSLAYAGELPALAVPQAEQAEPFGRAMRVVSIAADSESPRRVRVLVRGQRLTCGAARYNHAQRTLDLTGGARVTIAGEERTDQQLVLKAPAISAHYVEDVTRTGAWDLIPAGGSFKMTVRVRRPLAPQP
jgi:lipopolysaccharide export system protein LptA